MVARGGYGIGFSYPAVPQSKARIRTQVSADPKGEKNHAKANPAVVAKLEKIDARQHSPSKEFRFPSLKKSDSR